LAAIALGWSACSGSSGGESWTSPIAFSVAVSMTVTDRPCQFVTNARSPVRSNVTPSGCSRLPRSIEPTTVPSGPDVGSMTVTVPPGGLVAPAGAERLLTT
jgi:hypothetical protein